MLKNAALILSMATLAYTAGTKIAVTLTFNIDPQALADYQVYGTKFVSQTDSIGTALTNVATTVVLAIAPAGAPTTGTVFLSDTGEIITYTGITGSSLTGCTRGTSWTGAAANNTTAAAHSVGATVNFLTYANARARAVSILLADLNTASASLGTASTLLGTSQTNLNNDTAAIVAAQAGAVN
jgi:hypothetical protein